MMHLFTFFLRMYVLVLLRRTDLEEVLDVITKQHWFSLVYIVRLLFRVRGECILVSVSQFSKLCFFILFMSCANICLLFRMPRIYRFGFSTHKCIMLVSDTFQISIYTGQAITFESRIRKQAEHHIHT